MPPPAGRQTSPRSSSRRRRTVRIVERKPGARAATISLLIAAATALLLPGIWWLYGGKKGEVLPEPRRLADVELEWRCPAGHTFRAFGQLNPRLCLKCDRPAHPLVNYVCPAHGPYRVMVEFGHEEQDGPPEPVRHRLVGRPWVAHDKELKCPRCGRPLAYRPAPLIDPARKSESRGGS